MTSAETPSPLARGWLRLREQAIEVRVRVSVRSARDGIEGFYGDRLKVRVRSAPTGGEANREIVLLLARAAGVRPSEARIVAGLRDRSKTIVLGCDDPREAAERLHRAVTGAVDKRRRRT